MHEGHGSDGGDEEFLDLVFERLVAAREDGTAVPDTDELLAGRERLRAHVEELQRTARTVTRARAEGLPVVPGYTLLSELGRGGMGAVYLARQDSVGGRKVALKVLPATVALSTRARQRFLIEANAIALLRHPHVVTVYDVVNTEGTCAYAMEWVQGASLGQVIDVLEARQRGGGAESALATVRRYPGGIERPAGETHTVFVCRIGIAVARALGELHRAGLVHRDVKPSNILLRRDGTALLSDFGLVHSVDESLTLSGFVGTLAYSSPEQLAGDPDGLDPRSDVYALGVTLYRALTLRLPFEARRSRSGSSRTPAGMLRLIEHGRSVPLRARDRRLPRDLETIVAKAIEVEPGRRYASADELADDLERMLSLQPIRARPSDPVTRTLKFLRRNRAQAVGIAFGSAISLALALAAVAYVFLVPRWVQAHVREARLALLDPLQANLLFQIVYWGRSWQGEAEGAPDRSGLRTAVHHYDSALRWSPFDDAIRLERDVVLAVLAAPRAAEVSSPTTPDDLRSAGLVAYLFGDVELALRTWERFDQGLDPTGASDPLVEAGLGILYLVREESARAYPRLRDACQAFPNVGFLTSYLADASLRCGDPAVAGRLLDAAASMPRQDPQLALTRIRADLLAARGRDSEAEALYRRAQPGTPANLHHARFLHVRGRLEEAIDQYVLTVSALRGSSVRAEYARVLDRWWAELGPEERTQRILSSVGRSPWDPRSLIARLRYYPAAARSESAAPARPGHDLASFGLAELARVLDVENGTYWSEVLESPLLVRAQRWALASPWPASLSRGLRRLAAERELLRSRRTRERAASPRPPVIPASDQTFFLGLGDLPGGDVSSAARCVSSDGSTVGGDSASERHGSRGEPFVWRAETGMMPLGTRDRGVVNGLSADGSVAVGVTWTVSEIDHAFRWTQSEGLIDQGTSEDLPTKASSVSDDGLLVVGQSCAEWRKASTWSSDRGWARIDAEVESISAAAELSRDGRWAAGFVRYAFGVPDLAARWSLCGGQRVLLPRASTATGVSDSGAMVGYFLHEVAGRVVSEAMCWTGDEPARSLGDLQGGITESAAIAVSRDATWIAGWGTSALGREAVLWDAHHEMYRVKDVLDAAGSDVPPGWRLDECFDITRNGDLLTICGDGTNPAGAPEAWVARVLVADSAPSNAAPDVR